MIVSFVYTHFYTHFRKEFGKESKFTIIFVDVLIDSSFILKLKRSFEKWSFGDC